VLTRLGLIVVVVLAARFAGAHSADAVALAPGAIAMAAGGLFPALILAVWWKRATAAGAIGAIVAGGAVTAALVLHSRYPGFLPFGDLRLTEITAGIVGLAVGFAAAAGLSLAFAPPAEERLVVVDAIRRPGGAPIVQESESL
jgi:cation/acetate symporter